MRRLDHLAQIFAVAEMRVHVEKILNAVAVIGFLMSDLLENRADPNRGHAEAFQITHLARQPFQCTADELSAGFKPAFSLLRGSGCIAAIPIFKHRRCAAGNDISLVVAIALFFSIGKAVEHQEIEHLVFPGRGRGEEFVIGQGREIQFGKTFFDHGKTSKKKQLC